jgi:hypothetical protein
VEGIRIRRFKRIKKYRRIRIQPLCGEHHSWVPYSFVGRSERFERKN